MGKNIIINIGRQFGGGGLGVASELGRKLGIPVYDRELIRKAAQDSGFSAELFEQSDEKRRTFSLSSIFTSIYTSPTENYMSDNGLFEIQCETIRKIAEQGSAVIVGRCSDYVLRDFDNTLNVFLTSPLSVRVERICERHDLPEDKAEALILQKDRSREEYYNYFTFGNWGVASTYDLCIDSSILGIEGTADFIIDFARRSGLL
ncbi:MAG: cytidylate kinase-like family protein [Bacteroidales bacterium]|nr:cytidylate kinase-like family protein [Bacteroidales bacterium]MBQ9722305.1 cytidylate kinase-like family protein [Bacteroidales bacterium]